MTGTRRIVHSARDPCLSRELNISSLDTSFSNLRTRRLFLTFSTSVLWLGWRGFFAAATLLSVFSLQDVHIHSVISLYLLKQTHNITHQLNGSCDQWSVRPVRAVNNPVIKACRERVCVCVSVSLSCQAWCKASLSNNCSMWLWASLLTLALISKVFSNYSLRLWKPRKKIECLRIHLFVFGVPVFFSFFSSPSLLDWEHCFQVCLAVFLCMMSHWNWVLYTLVVWLICAFFTLLSQPFPLSVPYSFPYLSL